MIREDIFVGWLSIDGADWKQIAKAKHSGDCLDLTMRHPAPGHSEICVLPEGIEPPKRKPFAKKKSS